MRHGQPQVFGLMEVLTQPRAHLSCQIVDAHESVQIVHRATELGRFGVEGRDDAAEGRDDLAP